MSVSVRRAAGLRACVCVWESVCAYVCGRAERRGDSNVKWRRRLLGSVAKLWLFVKHIGSQLVHARARTNTDTHAQTHTEQQCAWSICTADIQQLYLSLSSFSLPSHLMRFKQSNPHSSTFSAQVFMCTFRQSVNVGYTVYTVWRLKCNSQLDSHQGKSEKLIRSARK